MRPSVAAAFRSFNRVFEGDVTWMYLDVKGLVTTGCGNLIDTGAQARALPWVHKGDGQAATEAEIAQAWLKVKGAQSMKMLGGGSFARLTDLRLTDDGVTSLVNARRDLDWTFLVNRFSSLSTWPADGQLAVLSIAWAAGPGWVAPKFDACAKMYDFVGMGLQGWLNDDGNPGLHPRNLANRLLFSNAAKVTLSPVTSGLDGATLYYPKVLS
jgi:hypothetical protein